MAIPILVENGVDKSQILYHPERDAALLRLGEKTLFFNIQARQEATLRTENLEDMTEELDMFYKESLTLEDWIDDTQERCRELQRSHAGVETQHNAFKVQLSSRLKLYIITFHYTYIPL